MVIPCFRLFILGIARVLVHVRQIMLDELNIGINHGFQCSNIRRITSKVFEHKAAGRVFKHLPSDPANV